MKEYLEGVIYVRKPDGSITSIDVLAGGVSEERYNNDINEINQHLTNLATEVENKANRSEIPDISGKANVGDSYTKAQSDAKYITQHQSLAGLATETYVNNKVAEIVNSAPAALDTLKELSDALGDDPNFATTVANQIGNKQDKITDIATIRTNAQNGNTALTEVNKLREENALVLDGENATITVVAHGVSVTAENAILV